MQQLMRDEAGNIFEVDASGTPVRLVSGPAAMPTQSTVVAPNPMRMQQQQREYAREDARDARADRREQAAAQRDEAAGFRDERRLVNENRSFGNQRFDNVSGLRKEFTGRKEVQDFNTILPQVANAMRIANNPNATGADDLNLIYTFGKVMDPGSVVREGELALASGTGSFAQNIEGAAQRVASGEKLPTEVRRNLVSSMRQRGVELARAYNLSRQEYQALAQRYGYNPADVVGAHPAKPFQQVEADFVGKPIGNLDGTIGARPSGGVINKERQSFSPKNVVDFAAGLSGGTYKFTEDGGLLYNGKEIPVSAEVANSPEYRTAYQAQYGKLPPLSVDIEGGELTPAAQTALEGRRDTFLGGVDAVGRGFADTATLGLADPLAAAGNTLTGTGTFADNLTRERATSKADEKVNAAPRFAGQFAGGLGPAVAAARLGMAALPARPALGALGAESAAGGIYGGLSNDKNRALGAAIGAGAALGGSAVGSLVLAPVARGMFGSRPGQAVQRGIAAAMDRPFVPPPARQPAADRLVAKATEDFGVDNMRASLDDAARLGLPFSPADASPQLRTLAGSAVRRSPNAREYAESVLEPRARGQAERAISAVRRDFGPTVNMETARADFKRQAQADSGDFYQQAFARAAPVDPQINAMLETPAGRQALNQAVTIARNEGRDPNGLGFDFNEAGDVMGVRAPSMETLHMVKRGFDGVVEGARDATGRLNRENPAVAAVDTLRSRFRGRLGELDDNYRQGNAAYSEQMLNRDGLNFGYDAVSPRINPDTLAEATQRLPIDTIRSGYRSGMVDQAERMRFNSNPYDAIYGTPDQVAKVGQLFPSGAQNFARQAELERQMAKTNYEAIGGSPTAARGQADRLLDPAFGAQALGETAIGMATGTPPIASMAQGARRLLSDGMRLGMGGEKKAEAIAPILLNPNPAQARSTLDEMIAGRQAYDEYRRRTGRVGGMFGASLGLPFIPVE